jgi:hypothetical protein
MDAPYALEPVASGSDALASRCSRQMLLADLVVERFSRV